MVQVTPGKPGETHHITDPATLRCESELLTLAAAVNEIDVFIASERQTYLTRIKPSLETNTEPAGSQPNESWEISEESDIHMQCLEHNLQAAINRLHELMKSAAELRAGIDLSQRKYLAPVHKNIAPIIN